MKEIICKLLGGHFWGFVTYFDCMPPSESRWNEVLEKRLESPEKSLREIEAEMNKEWLEEASNRLCKFCAKKI